MKAIEQLKKLNIECSKVYFDGMDFHLDMPEIDLIYVNFSNIKKEVVMAFYNTYKTMQKFDFFFEDEDKKKLLLLNDCTKEMIHHLYKKAEARYDKDSYDFWNEIYNGMSLEKLIKVAETYNYEDEQLKLQDVFIIKPKKEINYDKLMKNFVRELKYAFVLMPLSDYRKLKKFIAAKYVEFEQKHPEYVNKAKEIVNNAKDKVKQVEKTLKTYRWRLIKAEYKFKKSVRELFATVEIDVNGKKESFEFKTESNTIKNEKYVKHEFFEIEEYNFKHVAKDKEFFEFNSQDPFVEEDEQVL